jgi:hypothetical protein
MSRKNGVEVHLARGAHIPAWILFQDKKVSVSACWVGKRLFRILRIRGGEARFAPGGSVEVLMPSSKGFRVAFGERKVLKIVDLASGKETRNFFFCERCLANTGQITDSRAEMGASFPAGDEITCSKCSGVWHRNHRD